MALFRALVNRPNHGSYLSYVFLIAAVTFVSGHWAERILPELFEHRKSPRAFMDFDCYAEASRRLLAGESVYAFTDGAQQHPRPCVAPELPQYVYTPFLAIVLSAVAGKDHCLLEILWLIINVSILLALIPLSITALELPKSPLVFSIAILLFGTLVPTLETITLGQINFVVLLMMVVAAISLDRGRVWWTSVTFATACALKIVPFVFGVVFLRWGRLSQVKAAAVLGAFVLFSFVLARADSPVDFLSVMLSKSSAGLASENNASLSAGLVRAFSLSGGALLTVHFMTVALVIGIATWAVRACATTAVGFPRITCILFAATISISPLLEAHHLVMTYPALLYMFVSAFRARPLRATLARLLVAAFLTSVLNSRGLPLQGHAPDAFANLVAKPAWIGVWGLIAWMCWDLRRCVHCGTG